MPRSRGMSRTNYQHLVTNPAASTSHRIKILKNVVLIALGIILLRLFFIQIIEHNAWVAKADEAHTLLETIVAKRGEIYMMDEGEPVAVALNQTTYQIIIDPAVTEKEGIKRALETYAKDYIAVNIDDIYNTEGLRYSIVAKNVPREAADKIAAENLGAIWFKKNNQRVYPEGDLASGLLGFVNADGLGQYGVEGSLNDALSGKDGLLKATADVNKVALSIGKDNVKIPAEDGKNVVLSVDRGLQKGVEEIAVDVLHIHQNRRSGRQFCQLGFYSGNIAEGVLLDVITDELGQFFAGALQVFFRQIVNGNRRLSLRLLHNIALGNALQRKIQANACIAVVDHIPLQKDKPDAGNDRQQDGYDQKGQ